MKESFGCLGAKQWLCQSIDFLCFVDFYDQKRDPIVNMADGVCECLAC